MPDFRSVPIPARMAKLERDERGYPIPVTVWRDMLGKPHFTINEESVRLRMIYQHKCSICGEKLGHGRWYVGGPLSAFHEHGLYRDPPVHHECMQYAMQVCPYLAMRTYSKRIDTRTIKNPVEVGRIFVDHTSMPDRPEVFVCAMATKHTRKTGFAGDVLVVPERPYRKMEFWRQGTQMGEPEAMAIIRPILDAAGVATP